MKKINCMVVDDEPTAREILKMHIEKLDGLVLVGTCKNAIEAFELINSQAVDLIFLDIKMPGITGISLAKSINKNIKVIFTTAYRDYAVEGFDLQAVDYLLKPISLERLLQAVHKYKSENSPVLMNELPEQNEGFIFVRSNRKMVKITLSEITHIESLSDYIKIYTTENTVITRESISNIEAKLPTGKFLRIHRSFIVSTDYITAYTHEYVELQNKSLPISRSYRELVIKYFEGL
ncbi:LytR/AlgR family response regulator transcription factor [Chondrinema litorale]|uniref:LytR/AlgR family response regulator transcription factor n=1 Tax=Chondrinema litorale TaxID=2994555 RepID=UPI002542C279|nr:response regulator transcription factor [Chondrinema litorale]UZR98364.1 response regulator transcription factor [Chondrinema litorale]